MPRSFLVKKVKLDTFSSADLESSYGRARSDLGVRLHEKGASGAEAGAAGAHGSAGGVKGQSVGVEGTGDPGNRPVGIRRTRGGGWSRAVEGHGDDVERVTQRQAGIRPRLGRREGGEQGSEAGGTRRDTRTHPLNHAGTDSDRTCLHVDLHPETWVSLVLSSL